MNSIRDAVSKTLRVSICSSRRCWKRSAWSTLSVCWFDQRRVFIFYSRQTATEAREKLFLKDEPFFRRTMTMKEFSRRLWCTLQWTRTALSFFSFLSIKEQRSLWRGILVRYAPFNSTKRATRSSSDCALTISSWHANIFRRMPRKDLVFGETSLFMTMTSTTLIGENDHHTTATDCDAALHRILNKNINVLVSRDRDLDRLLSRGTSGQVHLRSLCFVD